MTSTLNSGGFVPPLLQHLDVRESVETQVSHVEKSMSLGLPQFGKKCRAHSNVLSIVGGGPSIKETVGELHGYVVAINGSLKWLLDRGQKVFACGVLDPGEHIAEGLVRNDNVRYFVSSTAHPNTFDKLKGLNVTIWHPGGCDEVNKVVFERNPDALIIGGGCTMGLRWINLGYMLGFRKFDCYGMDSSFSKDGTHAYPDWKDDAEERFIKSRGYTTSRDMLQQVADYLVARERFTFPDSDGIEVNMHGDHLMREAHDLWEGAMAC